MERIDELDPPDPYTAPAFFLEEDLPITLDHFAGIEIEEWPAQIAQTALHLVNHQANKQMELALGRAPEPLPLEKVDAIHVGNALRMDWRKIFLPSPDVYVMGNPPFIGARWADKAQKADLLEVWGKDASGNLDYVTGWYKKAADYYQRSPQGQFAFVSTNSIAQGQAVELIFRPLFAEGWRIFFAHQTFAWTSEAPGQAAVHVAIIGMEKGRNTPRRLFTYPDIKADPAEVPAKQINGFLLDAPQVWVKPRRAPLGNVTPIRFGSMPNDGGNLIVEVGEHAAAAADPLAAKYLRPFRGSRELVQGLERWCLWLEKLDPEDLSNSKLLRDRITAVKQHRKLSRRDSTRALASTPHLFGERRQPNDQYVMIPRVTSELRPYITASHLEQKVIASDAAFTAEDPDGFLFAIVSSSMFITWQRMVGGRLKSDLRFSSTLVWNNLPLPEVSDDLRQKIIEAGRRILEVREEHPERSLADHYNPLAMEPRLIAAHNALDHHVDKAFGASKPLQTNEERQAVLLRRYKEMTAEAGS